MTEAISVDAHVLISKVTPKVWVDECIESIYKAANSSPFKVNLFTLSGVEGNIGLGRANGYSLGNAPYVTYIDDDDYLVKEAFCDVASALEQRPDAVFPGEYLLHDAMIRIGLRRHHLPFYKREHLIDHRLWLVSGDPRQIYALRDNRVIDVPIPLYYYRIYHNSPASIITKKHSKEWHDLPNVNKILKPFDT